MDLRWTSQGGVLIDGTGDLAVTLTPQEELETMTATRLKAAVDGWKSYAIGAGLEDFKGSSIGINQNTELAIQRRVTSSLTNQFLPAGSFTVQTRSLPRSAQHLPRARGEDRSPGPPASSRRSRPPWRLPGWTIYMPSARCSSGGACSVRIGRTGVPADPGLSCMSREGLAGSVQSDGKCLRKLCGFRLENHTGGPGEHMFPNRALSVMDQFEGYGRALV